MTHNKNHFEFSGTIERFARVQTKTGSPMISFMARCYKEALRCIAFGDVAEQTTLQRGDQVECCGRVQNNRWVDAHGQGHEGWQVVCDSITVIADDDAQEPPAPRQEQRPEPRQERMFDQGRRPDPGERFQVQPDTPF